MSGALKYNVEIKNRIPAALEVLDGVFKDFEKCVNEGAELAQESGSDILISSTGAAVESLPGLKATVQETYDSIMKLKEAYAKIDEVMNQGV